MLDRIEQFDDAGADELYLQQIGPEQEDFFRAWSEVLGPRPGAR